MYDGQNLALVKDEWARALGIFTVAEVDGALTMTVHRHPSWPPTLGEFVAMCRAQLRPVLYKLDAPRYAAPAGVFEVLRAKAQGRK